MPDIYNTPEEQLTTGGVPIYKKPTGDYSITADTLKPVTPFNVAPVNEPPVYPVAGLDATAPTPPQTLTGPEQEVQRMIDEAKGVNEQLVGESAYHTQQEGVQGIEALNRTQTDLSARLKALQNEANAIPLQLQQESIGRGITAGGLQPIQTAALRNNAIQALSVSSLLEASRGNLTLAADMVDKAVAARFDPIKAKRDALIANLDLIIKSPEYTVAEKNRAQAQLDIQEAKKKAIAKQEENEKTGQAMAIAAIKNYGSDEAASFAAQQVSKLDSTDPNYIWNVFSLVGEYQSDPNELAKELADLQYKQAQTESEKMQAQKIKADIELQPLVIQKSKAEIAKIYSDIAKSNADIAKINAETTLAGTYAAGGDVTVDAYIAGIRNGTYKPSDVPKNIKDKVAQGLAQITPAMKNADLDKAQKLKDAIAELKNNKSLNRAVGPLQSKLPTFTKGVADFEAYFNTVRSLLTLENMGLMKGVLSDADIKILKEAATPLSLNMSETAFKKELTKMETIIDTAITRAKKAETNIVVEDTYVVNGKTYKKGTDGLYYEQ
jgi:hypothetical protein